MVKTTKTNISSSIVLNSSAVAPAKNTFIDDKAAEVRAMLIRNTAKPVDFPVHLLLKRHIDPNEPNIVERALCLLDKIGIADYSTAYKHLIAGAKDSGTLPNDFNALKETLKSFGFFMQSSYLEDKSISFVLRELSCIDSPAVVLIQDKDYNHIGGKMLAFRTNGTEFTRTDSCSYDLSTKHVWIRWDDGKDRSPFPRRAVKPRGTKASSAAKNSCLVSYQPNSKRPFTGDCCIRALAGAMDISWEEALDLLAESGRVVVNDKAYWVMLYRLGFVPHGTITRDNKPVNGVEFCKEMDFRMKNGERIIAIVGKHHVAAVVPKKDESGVSRYKILDSWDCSEMPFYAYFVLSDH